MDKILVTVIGFLAGMILVIALCLFLVKGLSTFNVREVTYHDNKVYRAIGQRGSLATGLT